MLSVGPPSRQTVTGPVMPVTLISTILVDALALNGVAAAAAGLAIGFTVTVAAPLGALSNFNVVSGISTDAGIVALGVPLGTAATFSPVTLLDVISRIGAKIG